MTIALTIREELGIDRQSELVEGGVWFPEGALDDAGRIRLYEGGAAVACQPSVDERWPDGSLRWASLAFLASVKAQSETSFALEIDATNTPASLSHSVTVVEDEEGLRVSTGAVAFAVRRGPFNPLEGLPRLRHTEIRVCAADGTSFTAGAALDTELFVLQSGPVVARVLARGSHSDEQGCTFLGFEVEIEAVAGSPEIAVTYRIVNREPGRRIALAAWELSLGLVDARAAICGAFDAVYRTTEPFAIRHQGDGHASGIFAVSELSSHDQWEDISDAEYLCHWEWSELSGRHASNWLTAEFASGEPLTVVVPHFSETHPSELRFERDSVTVGFWPRTAEALWLTQGMAPCGRFVVRVATNDDPPQRFAGRRVARLVPRQSGRPWESGNVSAILARDTERFPRLESHIREELFSWCLGGQAKGLLDHGDCFQVRSGPRAGFTANNEHDALYALCLHYIRSGERAYLASAEAYGDHLVDVDLIHHSDQNSFESGGLRAHGVGHVHYVRARTQDGVVETSIDTGHMWVEGLLLLSALTGRRHYRDAACRVGECLLGLIEIGWTRPEPGPRNSGWPLIALSALYRSTLDERYLDGARRVAREALRAQGSDGRWTMRTGFYKGYCAWQNAVLLIGLSRLLAVDDSADIDHAFRSGSDALLTLGRHDDGGFIYVDRFDYRWISRHALIREALAAAFAHIGDERFLLAGLEGGASAWLRPRSQQPVLSGDIAEWRGHLPFFHELDRVGLLRDLGHDELREMRSA